MTSSGNRGPTCLLFISQLLCVQIKPPIRLRNRGLDDRDGQDNLDGPGSAWILATRPAVASLRTDVAAAEPQRSRRHPPSEQDPPPEPSPDPSLRILRVVFMKRFTPTEPVK